MSLRFNVQEILREPGPFVTATVMESLLISTANYRTEMFWLKYNRGSLDRLSVSFLKRYQECKNGNDSLEANRKFYISKMITK